MGHNFIKKAIKRAIKFFEPLIQSLSRWYFSKPRNYNYQGISFIILPGVFFPHFTFSTRLLMDFISSFELNKKHFLELGCGAALIAVLAAKKGAIVTASDLNPEAVKNAKINSNKNGLTIKTLKSDLFENIDEKHFHFICINPPFYPKNPKNYEEAAWFCGSEYQYFIKLFKQLPLKMNNQTTVFMILSQDCDIPLIQKLARKEGIIFEKKITRKNYLEENYIFQLHLDKQA